ncbi:hypothetical protein E2C11_16475 [Streptomyces lavendulae]|nr:hypothetical protein [Streptomyces lavendulae]TXJ78601.1 hypothetical protein E2C11_16475 [Streptomyces lavendulae]
MSASFYSPLYGPDHAQIDPADLASELWLAKDFLTEAAIANVHDHIALIETASGLYYRLAALTAAVEADNPKAVTR